MSNTPVPEERPLTAPAFEVSVSLTPVPKKRAPKKRAPKTAAQPAPPDETPQTTDDTDTEEK